MPRPPGRPARRAPLLVALALLLAATLGAAGCSSDAAAPAKPAKGSTAAAKLRAKNRAYLLGISWEREQADCVSKETHVDIADLLSGADGAGAPTKKPGFDDFAAAVRACIRQDTQLSTTTVPPG